MPTIELVSIGCTEIPEFPSYAGFACLAETDLQSHRSLFQPTFDLLKGVIIHVGNKSFEGQPEGGWFAGQAMRWSEENEGNEGNTLRFLPRGRADFADLLRRLLGASPDRRLTFSSDYQFGGATHEHGPVSMAQLLEAHDSGTLRYNSLWWVHD